MERLRLAQNIAGRSANGSESAASRRPLAERRQQLRSPTESTLSRSTRRASPRRLQKAHRTKSVSLQDASWFQSLPEKIQQQQFSKEEQRQLSGRRDSFILLDATDEAVFRACRRNRSLADINRINQEPLDQAPLSPTTIGDMRFPTLKTVKDRPTSIALAMAEQFRWMDEESDLDLRLKLDDYHANLPDAKIPAPDSTIRPSFRRNVSIGNTSFSRPTKPPALKPTSGSTSFKRTSVSHSRGHSRAVSLMSPKFAPVEEAGRHSIDPNATHYQNPDARMKLRVYLASPQKFDEAIEFGFPSDQSVIDAERENRTPHVSGSKSQNFKAGQASLGRTFFVDKDDTGSLMEDDSSIMEPESPATPSDDVFKHQHSRLIPASTVETGMGRKPMHRQPESYSLASTGNREMTLRMTLTRPDLRAQDEVVYGYQAKERSKSPLTMPALSTESEVVGASVMRGPFEGEDGWGPTPKDNGVVKRLWNKVKRPGQKNTVSW